MPPHDHATPTRLHPDAVADLDRAVAAVDDDHRRSMADVADAVDELHRGPTARALRGDAGPTLRTAAMTGGALALGSVLLPYRDLLAGAGVSARLDDVDIAAYAQSVELAAVAAYGAAAPKLTTPAVAAAATAFMAHHRDHAGAFGKAAGSKAPGKPNSTILASVGGKISGAADEAAVLEIAFAVENAAASTYLFAIGALSSSDALALTASILPIEAQHAVILGTVLGKPVGGLFPEGGRSFETTVDALTPEKNPM